MPPVSFACRAPSSFAAPTRTPSAVTRQSTDGNVGPSGTVSHGSPGSVVVVGGLFARGVGVVVLVVTTLVVLDVDVLEEVVELVVDVVLVDDVVEVVVLVELVVLVEVVVGVA